MVYTCPVKLNESANKIWRKVIKELKPSDSTTVVDLYSIAAYCMEMDLYYQCMEEVGEKGSVIEMTNGQQELSIVSPYYKNAKTALANARSIGDRFGFNLLSRQKMKVVEEPEENDPLDDD